MLNKYNLTKEKKIGVFDSGVGGLSILNELVKILPNENFIYYGDYINSPYGDKSKKEITSFVFKISDFLLKNECKIIVIACNTATSAAIHSIREKVKIPIIGVINNSINATLKQTNNNNICVIGTKFTINSKVYIKEFKKTNKNLNIYQISCPKLCPMIEDGWEKYDNRLVILKNYINKIPNNVDTLLLGCTHYTIIKNDIAKYFNGVIINSALETAIDTKNTLSDMDLLNKNGEGRILFCMNSDINKVMQLVNLKNIF